MLPGRGAVRVDGGRQIPGRAKSGIWRSCLLLTLLAKIRMKTPPRFTAFFRIPKVVSGSWKGVTTDAVRRTSCPLRFQFSGRSITARGAGRGGGRSRHASAGAARSRRRLWRATLSRRGKKIGDQGAHRRRDHGGRKWRALATAAASPVASWISESLPAYHLLQIARAPQGRRR